MGDIKECDEPPSIRADTTCGSWLNNTRGNVVLSNGVGVEYLEVDFISTVDVLA